MSACQHSFPTVADGAAQAAQADRRRPGRVDDVSPELVALLRGTAPYRPAPAPGPRVQTAMITPHADNAPLLGLAFGLLFSIPLWAVAGLILWVQFG